MRTQPPLEIWSPLPPAQSGVADYVQEQLDALSRTFALTLVAEAVEAVSPELRSAHRVVRAADASPAALRLYHVGNSPSHAFIFDEALRVPGIVVLHEWNLHELQLGSAVRSNDFRDYEATLRREHGARGAVAARTIGAALGGRHWTSVFPLNASLLERATAVVCLSAQTARRVQARVPGTPVLTLPHHALLRSRTQDRASARALLSFDSQVPLLLAPGLATGSKSLDLAIEAMRVVREVHRDALLCTVGGGDTVAADGVRHLGRVDLETLGDALVAADVVLALRFPSRGEVSGVLMRALAAGRAAVVSSGSTADDDLPQGLVARVDPGPDEAAQLAAVISFFLSDRAARERVERLAAAEAANRKVDEVTERLASFIVEIASRRDALEARVRESAVVPAVPELFRNEVMAAASSLGIARLPKGVLERLTGLL